MQSIRRLIQLLEDPELARALFPIVFAIGAIIAIGFLGAGCSLHPGSSLPTRTAVSVANDPELDAYCRSLNRRYIAFTATGAGAAVLGGATGIPAMLTTDTPRWVTGSISALTATSAAIFTVLSTLEAQAYNKACVAGTTGAP